MLLSKTQIILLGAFFVTVTIYIYSKLNVTTTKKRYTYSRNSIQCYHIRSDTLPDISDTQPAKGRSIFFHETSCNSHLNGKISITAREACAVESAARMNPDFEVHLLYTSPGQMKFEGTESDRFLQALLRYNNVKILHVDYERYTKGSPVERLYKKGLIERSKYSQSHASDVLRYLTLWKYGGIYLDLDVIVINSLQELPLNYAGAQESTYVAAGVLSFSPDGAGHDFARRCLEDLGENFKGSVWGYNGPGVITRLLQKVCGVKTARQMINGNCQGFTVYPTGSFYAIPYWKWWMFFDEVATEHVLDNLNDSYVVHVWNNLSANATVRLGEDSAYAVLAREFCPNVVEQCGDVF